MEIKEIKKEIFDVEQAHFEALALKIFAYQAANNKVYKRFIELLGININQVQSLKKVPFLPIQFFKNYTIQTGEFTPAICFSSSGTTGQIRSQHLVKDLSLYESSFKKGFEHFYGPIDEYCILGLLPSYLEREGSSLIYMAEKMMEISAHPSNGFYLNEHEALAQQLASLVDSDQKVLLIGVTFGLLDFAEQYQLQLGEQIIVMETGGMKGRRKEMIRDEVHAILGRAFGQTHIHSEYGMTELLSQAYSKGDGIFHCPPWMKVMCRGVDDPLSIVPAGRAGILNIIDLANIHSCAFIATDDIGRSYEDGSFEVQGRIDHSDVRGCNLLVI